MESDTLIFLEWRIENFSCWRADKHGRSIKSKEFGDYRLYPKGLSGIDDCIMVHIHEHSAFKSAGEFYFIGPNGSIIYKQQLNPEISEQDLEIPNGPRFVDVVAVIRKYEAEYGDSLTLQFRVEKVEFERHIKTVIEVINLPTIGIDVEEVKSHRRISHIRYSEVDTLYLNTLEYVVDDENAKIPFTLKSYSDRDEDYLFLVRTRVSLMTSDGSLTRYEENEHMFETKSYETETWKFSHSLTKREMKEKGVDSILFYIKVINGNISESHFNVIFYAGARTMPSDAEKPSKNSDHTAPEPPNSDTTDTLSKDLTLLYQNQDFSDFQLKCGDETFPVHKNILSSRSPVFKRLFSTHMSESASGCLDIADLDPSTLSSFLGFLYGGTTGDLQGESAIKLYYAADNYDVPSLKRQCGSYLSANLCVGNVCDVLALANKHGDEELAGVTRDFISRNFGEVLRSPEWKNFMRVEPLLVAETLTLLAERNLASSRFSI